MQTIFSILHEATAYLTSATLLVSGKSKELVSCLLLFNWESDVNLQLDLALPSNIVKSLDCIDSLILSFL